MSARVLAIEDDVGIGSLLRRGLEAVGHRVTVVPSLAAARRIWMSGSFDIVLLDVMLPDGDGLDLLAERRLASDRTPVVLLSAREESDLLERAVAAGISGHLSKPFAYADLLSCIGRLAPSAS
jgi:DNA-binding response OmpR family regulator